MSASTPPADLRARVLAAARAEPSPPRSAGAMMKRVLLLVAGFGLSGATLYVLGGPGARSRPVGYFLAVTLMWLVVGVVAVWVAVLRGRSMLGRPASWKLAVAALTPVALAATALGARMSWPGTLGQPAEMHDHIVCLVFTVVMATGPFAAFVALRRGSDPVSPRLTGAAVGATAGALGGLCIELVCSRASMVHVVVGHVIPVVALTLVGLVVGGAVLRVREPAADRGVA